jgi:hypothetical protein
MVLKNYTVIKMFFFLLGLYLKKSLIFVSGRKITDGAGNTHWPR